MRMLCCPALSPFSFSRRFPGGTVRSSNRAATSSIASFRMVMRAGGEPRVFPLLQRRSVSASAKLSITTLIATYVVNNVKRYYTSCFKKPDKPACSRSAIRLIGALPKGRMTALVMTAPPTIISNVQKKFQCPDRPCLRQRREIDRASRHPTGFCVPRL